MLSAVVVISALRINWMLPYCFLYLCKLFTLLLQQPELTFESHQVDVPGSQDCKRCYGCHHTSWSHSMQASYVLDHTPCKHLMFWITLHTSIFCSGLHSMQASYVLDHTPCKQLMFWLSLRKHLIFWITLNANVLCSGSYHASILCSGSSSTQASDVLDHTPCKHLMF